MIEYINIFLAFLIPGIIGFGGGAGSLALTNNCVVDIFQIITQQEMNVIISFSNALPGPIATLLAFGTGFYAKGVLGGTIAFTAMVLPSSIIIIILYNFLIKHKDDYRIKRITKFITPLIFTIFINLTIQFVNQSFISINNDSISVLLIVISLVSIAKFKVHPAIMIFISMIIGFFVL